MQLISNFPWYYTLLCLVAGFVFSGLLYYRDKQNAERSKYLRYGLALLRFLSVSLIALLLLDVFIKRLVNETEKPVIIIAQDNSSSIVSGKDSTYYKTIFTNEFKDFTEAVNQKYEVRSYQFDSESRSLDNLNYLGKETNIAGIFKDIENNFANKNIGAIVLVTDGIYNKGANPLYSIDKINAPIYSIALGDTIPLKDVWIQNITHNQVAYLGNVFPVEVNVSATDLNGKDVQVSISHKDKILKTEKIKINAKSFNQTLNYTLDANESGVQKFTVSISVLQDEKNTQNNNQSFVIEVIDNREKVLILANAPHPDIAALEQSISSAQTYEVEVASLNEFSKPLKPYSLVIIHQAGVIPQRIATELKTNNQSVFYIGGNFLNNGAKSLMNSKTNEVEGIYHTDFSLFTLTDELKNYIREFPAVLTPFKTAISQNASQILIAQKIGVVETDEPLLSFSEINGVKTGVFTGDGLWRWRMRDFQEHENHNLFNELINKTVQYLSVKADKSFFRVTSKKIINENESLDFTAEVYNQSYELVTDPDVTLVIRDSKNKSYNYVFSKKQTMYSLSAGQFPPGEYTFEAQVKYGDKLYTKKGLITVKEIVSEKINTVANHQLLYQMSRQSGGKLFYKNELNKLKEEILSGDSFKSITYSHKQLTDLVNLKWLFFIILAFLSTEWFLRKYNGKV